MVNFPKGVSELSELSGTDKQRDLTPRQREIYDFLADKINNRGYGPTVREIGLEFNIKSPNGVICHLKALERKGLIRRESNMSRAIGLVESRPKKSTMKMLGVAAAGAALQPVSAEQEAIDVDLMIGAHDSVCVKIEGSHFSMLGINDADLVVIRQVGVPTTGSVVAALDNQGGLMLTRQTISASDVPSTSSVLGTVTNVIRKFTPTHGSLPIDDVATA